MDDCIINSNLKREGVKKKWKLLVKQTNMVDKEVKLVLSINNKHKLFASVRANLIVPPANLIVPIPPGSPFIGDNTPNVS